MSERQGQGPALPRVAWAGLAALACGHLAVDCCTGIWPVYKTLAHLDLARAGLIATVSSMLGNGLQIAFGVLADRGGRRRLAVLGISMAGAVTLLPWVHSYGQMTVLVLVTYVAAAAFHPAGTGSVAAVAHSRTGAMVGLFLGGGYVGYALSQLLFSAIYTRQPLATPLLLVIPITAAVAVRLFVSEAPAPTHGSHGGIRSLRGMAGSIGLLFAVQVFATAINVSLIFLLPDLLLARGAPDWLVQGGGHFALVAGGCLSLIPAGHAADRFGARRVLLAANLGTGVLLWLLLSRNSASTVDLLILAAFGAFNASNNVVVVAEGNRLLPGQASSVSSLLMGLPWGLAAVGPSLAGFLADPGRGGTPVRALTMLGIAIPLALSAAIAIRPTRQELASRAPG